MKIEYGFTHEGRLHKFATPRAARAARFQFTGKIGPAAEIITIYTPEPDPRRSWRWAALVGLIALIAAWAFGLTGNRFETIIDTIGVLGCMIVLFFSMWVLLVCVEYLLDTAVQPE